MINKQIILIFIIFFQNFLYALDGTPDSNNKTGYLVDSMVNGVNYKCSDNSYSDITGAHNGNGSFTIKSNCSNIIFTLNDKVTLGNINVANINNDSRVYITDLVGLSRDDTNNTKVKNIIRVLQTLDDDLDYSNGINISTTTINNITSSKNLQNANEEDLNSTIIDAGYSNRTLVSEICALVHFEQTLRDNNINVDTVPPCIPRLTYDINATANNKTYIELIGEKGSKIFLNGEDTNLTIDKNGLYIEFELNTSIKANSFHEFNLTFVDDINQTSKIKNLRIFNDTDQPVLNNIPLNVNIPVGNTNILDLNISDSSLENNISINYEVNNTLFEINSTGNLHFKSPATTGIYIINIKVIDQVLHWVDDNLTITVP